MEPLELNGVVGLSAKHQGTVVLTAEGDLVHPVGAALVLRQAGDPATHAFLPGSHDAEVTCAALSASGKYLAAGGLTHQGQVAPVLVHDLTRRCVAHALALHKTKVQAVGESGAGRAARRSGGPPTGRPQASRLYGREEVFTAAAGARAWGC